MPQPANTPTGPFTLFGRAPGTLDRFPGAFQELAMLRIHDGRFLRAKPEEIRDRTVPCRRGRRCAGHSSGRETCPVTSPAASSSSSVSERMDSTLPRKLRQNSWTFVAPGTRSAIPTMAMSVAEMLRCSDMAIMRAQGMSLKRKVQTPRGKRCMLQLRNECAPINMASHTF